MINPAIKKYRTLIADDEQPARDRLKQLLSAYSSRIELVGEAENGIQCCQLIRQFNPDLLFLDIQMPGLNGFEVLQQVENPPVVIFCTAFDEYALKAFETSSIDYIVKPITKERIQKSIEKLDALKNHQIQSELVELIGQLTRQQAKREITTIPVKLGDRMLFIKIEDITYFLSDEKYVAIFTTDGKKYLCDYPLKNLEEKLGDTFLRIQRSVLVNVKRIKEINRHFNGRYTIILDDLTKTRLVSGRNYSAQIRILLEI
jgi:two-component system LytT family response regulator